MVMSSPVMSEAARARLATLWRRIEDAHYSYLDTDDSPEKLQRKKKLDGFITEYLSLVPPSCRFVLPETAEVFARTVRELPEFSAYRAGIGWAALARYAANLLTQPWRKEYKVIRLYSGVYKHEVEANMVGAERVLGALGYRGGGGGGPGGAGGGGPGRASLRLQAPLCPDAAAAVSRDALLATQECQIMCEMYEASWKNGVRTTWLQVWNQRQNSHDITLNQDIYSNLPPTINPIPGDIHRNRYIDTRFTHNGTRYADEPTEEPIAPIIHPQYMIPPMMYPIPQEVPVTVPMITPYGVPCYYPAPYMIPTPVYAPIKQATTIPINGYPPQGRFPAVPTAQLIELDPPNVYENGKHDRHREDDRQDDRHRRIKQDSRLNSSRSNFSDVTLPSLPRSDTQPALSKAKEDGMGTYESWDYVFRNLSSKDHDERSRFSPSLDRDSRTLDRLDRDDKRSKYHPTTLDLEDGLQALSFDRSHDDSAYRTAKVNENLMKLKQEQELRRARLLKKQEDKKTKRIDSIENPSSDALIPSKVAPDKVKLLTKKDVKDRKEVLKQQNSINGDGRKIRKPSKLVVDERQRSKPLENGVAHSSKSSSASTSQTNYDLKSQLIVSLDEPDSVRGSPPKTNGDVSSRHAEEITSHSLNLKWECGTCTYLNRGGMQVCEMCGKSRKGPEIQPLTSGGKECPACTLVNQRQSRVCDACGTSLEHCPTYI